MSEEQLARWDRWFQQWFPCPHMVRRSRLDGDGGGHVWHVEFQDGKLGRVHVDDDLVDITDDHFRRLTRALEEGDWYAELDGCLRVRILANGSVDPIP